MGMIVTGLILICYIYSVLSVILIMQLRISTDAGGVHDVAIIATCIRAHHSNSFQALPLLCALMQVAMIAASCTPPLLLLSWSVVVVVGVACCCCIPFRLALMLVLTFAPYTLAFAPCACGGCHWQQLLVVVFLPQQLVQTPLAPAVVSPIAICGSGVFPSTHWRRYRTYAQATRTVWYYIFIYIHLLVTDVLYILLSMYASVYSVNSVCRSEAAAGGFSKHRSPMSSQVISLHL